MSDTPGRSDFTLRYEISPIFLTGGSAGGLPGGTLPILSLIQPAFSGLLSGGGGFNFDGFFRFRPLPGGTLAQQKIGTYPFANQATAANAVIRDPISISMLMLCPANQPGSYSLKQAILSALKATLDQHNANGGTYAVNTPAFLYTDCLLARLSDVTSGESKQVQYGWQWDFIKPLISLADASAAQNNLMGKISSGSAVTTNTQGEITFSDLTITAGNPASGAAGVFPDNLPNSGLGYGSSNVPEEFSVLGDTGTIPPGIGGGAAIGSFVGQNSDVTGFTVPF